MTPDQIQALRNPEKPRDEAWEDLQTALNEVEELRDALRLSQGAVRVSCEDNNTLRAALSIEAGLAQAVKEIDGLRARIADLEYENKVMHYAVNGVERLRARIAELEAETRAFFDHGVTQGTRIAELERAGDAMASDLTVPFTGAMQAWRKLRRALDTSEICASIDTEGGDTLQEATKNEQNLHRVQEAKRHPHRQIDPDCRGRVAGDCQSHSRPVLLAAQSRLRLGPPG
jgi:chromosome segregation ATPase